MRQRFHHAVSGVPTPPASLDPIKRKLFLRGLQNDSLTRLFSIDPTMSRWCEREIPQLARRVIYLPDPADFAVASPVSSARAGLGIPEQAIIVLVYGSISPRKGIAPLLQAAMQCGEIHVLLAGMQTVAAKKILQTDDAAELERQGRLHQVDHFLDNEQQRAVFAAADIVWLCYLGHDTMSGVIVLAGAAGKPVLSCSRGLIGWMTSTYECGLAVDATDSPAVAAALQNLIANPGLRQELGANGRKHFAAHTVRNFTDPVVNLLANQVAD